MDIKAEQHGKRLTLILTKCHLNQTSRWSVSITGSTCTSIWNFAELFFFCLFLLCSPRNYGNKAFISWNYYGCRTMRPENLKSTIIPNNGDCQRIIMQDKEKARRIRNIRVAHIQKYHVMHIRPNITKARWDRLKNSTTGVHQITSGERFSKCFWEGPEVYKKERHQINDMEVVPSMGSENTVLCHLRSRSTETIYENHIKDIKCQIVNRQNKMAAQKYC